MADLPHVTNDLEHAKACHGRWSERRNRRQQSSDYRDEWWAQQCGGCRFWIPLMGVLGSDYGACTSSASEFDGRVMFEHDGCPAFDAASTFGG